MRKCVSRTDLLSLFDERSEKASPEEREKALDKRLERQVRLAYRSSPAVRETLDGAGTAPSRIRTIRDLERLPVTTKDDLVEMQRSRPPFGGFLGVPISSLDRIYVSPGPLYSLWGPERIQAQTRSFLRLGHPRPGDVVMVSTSYHMSPSGLAITDTLDMMGCTVIPAGTGQPGLQVKLLHELHPTALFGSLSFAMEVLQKAEGLGYDVREDFSLKYVQCVGEKHIQPLKKSLEERFGLVVGDAYETPDVGPIAYCCGMGDGYHYDDEAAAIEIVDPQTGRQLGPGEAGQVVVTPFSRVYPLVRFGTGEKACYTDEPCRCGRSAPRLVDARCMARQQFRVKGILVHQRDLEEAMSSFLQIPNYQMLVTLDGHKDRAVLKIEVPQGANLDAVALAVARRCQDVFKVSLDGIEIVPEGALSGSAQGLADQRWG